MRRGPQESVRISRLCRLYNRKMAAGISSEARNVCEKTLQLAVARVGCCLTCAWGAYLLMD